MAKTIKIAGELESMATGGVVAAASAIKDKVKNKYQSEINNDVARHENEIHGTGGIDSRLDDLEAMEQIVIDGGDAQIATGSDFTNPDATKRAKIPTVGAILDGLNDGVYDVSKRNPTGGPNSDGKFTLEYILSNADTLIPTSRRYGGMIISFADTSDNNYVQFRCKTQTFSANPEDWYFEGDDTLVENPEFIAVYTDADGKIIIAVENDGNIHFGAGVPKQVIDYITAEIAKLSLDEYDDIVAFLGTLINGDKTLAELLNEKVDKVEGKSLIPTQYIQEVENPEFIKAELDAEQKLLGGIKKDGTYWFNRIESPILDNLQKEVNDAIEESQEALIEHYDYYNVSKHHTIRDVFNIYTANIGWQQVEYDSTVAMYDELDVYQIGEVCNYGGDTEHSYEALIRQRGVAPAIVTQEYVTRRKFTLDEAISLLPAEILTAFAAGQMICFVDLDDIVEEWQLSESGSWVRVNPYEIKDPEGRFEIKLDNDNKIIAYRKADGTWVECVGIEAPNLGDYVDKEEGKGLINSEYAESVDVIEDPEGRHEITLDFDKKIVSYRKEDGTKVENVGIETNHLELTEQGMSDFQQSLKDAGFNPSVAKIKDYNLPKFGHTNIVSETFYLTADSRYSDKSGIYLIRDYPDTDENAMNHVTLDYFYIKSTLTDNGDGTYSKNANSVRLDFYAATKVTKLDETYYVTSSLTEITDPVTGEVIGYEVNENSIAVTQIVDVPPINAWSVDKKTKHNCVVDVDFGEYLSGTFYAQVNLQGSSTLNFRKRNLRYTFYKNDKFEKKLKVKVGEMVRTSGYNLKANWNDNSRIKEDIMTILLMAVWENRGSYKNYPWDDDVTPFTSATGMIKGFPIEVSIGGNFYGLDIFGLKKDKANYLLDKDKDGMIQGGTRGNWRDTTNWTAASPGDWEDELNDEEDWDVMYPSGNGQTASNDAALKEFFEYINGRLYEDGSGVAYLNTQVTEVGGKFYVTSTLTPDQSSVTATRTSNPAYIGSDDNLYILAELTEISGTLYVTATLVDDQPTADSVTATLVEGGHNIYAGSDGNRYLSTSLTLIDGVYYVTSKIVWDTTSSTEVSNIPFDKKTMPERMSIPYWIDYIICMQVFLMRDNTCRNLMLYSAADKKKFYPFFYDLDLSWNFNFDTYNLDIMVPADPSGQGGGVSYAGDMSLWENFKDAWWDEMINRYNELRRSVLTIPYITQVYKEVANNIPDEEYSKENNRWNKATTKKTFENLISYMELRLDWLDNEYYK